jgi:hypothetical protein
VAPTCASRRARLGIREYFAGLSDRGNSGSVEKNPRLCGCRNLWYVERNDGALQALADGETNPAALAALADERLRATPEQLCDALGACTELNAVYRRLLKMALEELRLIEEQIGELDKEMASLLSEHRDAVQRLEEVPGLGWTPRSRSLLKSALRQQPFRLRNVSPRGSALARATTRAQA